jgi:phage shock protein A
MQYSLFDDDYEKTKERVKKARNSARSAITQGEARTIIKKLVELAINEGNVRAASLLLDVLGVKTKNVKKESGDTPQKMYMGVDFDKV